MPKLPYPLLLNVPDSICVFENLQFSDNGQKLSSMHLNIRTIPVRVTNRYTCIASLMLDADSVRCFGLNKAQEESGGMRR